MILHMKCGTDRFGKDLPDILPKQLLAGTAEELFCIAVNVHKAPARIQCEKSIGDAGQNSLSLQAIFIEKAFQGLMVCGGIGSLLFVHPQTPLITAVMHVAFAEFKGDKGEDEDDNKEYPPHSAGITHFMVDEGVIEEVHGIEIDRAGRSALRRDDVGHGKNLEGTDDSHDDVEEDDRGDHGKGNVNRFCPPARSIEVCGLVELSGHVL